MSFNAKEFKKCKEAGIQEKKNEVIFEIKTDIRKNPEEGRVVSFNTDRLTYDDKCEIVDHFEELEFDARIDCCGNIIVEW